MSQPDSTGIGVGIGLDGVRGNLVSMGRCTSHRIKQSYLIIEMFIPGKEYNGLKSKIWGKFCI